MKEDVKKNKELRAAISLRVSKKDQENGYGLKYQLEDCRKVLEEDGFVFDKELVYSDTVSGKNDVRKNWQRLLDDAKQGKIDIVYFWKLDRMMRDEYYYYMSAKELEDAGVEIRFATQDLKDPFHRAIQVAVAAEERRKIIERTKRGRDMAMKDGKWVWGPPTYGYRHNVKTHWIEIWDEQAEWVRKIFSWLVDEQCSLKEIARRLNDNNVPTWTQSIKSKRKVSKTWWPRTIGRMLLNELYTGETYFHKYKTGEIGVKSFENAEYLRDEKDWHKVTVPPIISKDLFERAVKQLKANSEFARRKKKRDYMFAGLVHCSKCGFKLRGLYSHPTSETSKGSRRYTSFMTSRYEQGSAKCKYCGTVAESRLMPIWHVLKSTLSNPALVYEKLKKYSGRSKIDDARDKIILIDKKITSLDEGERRLSVAYLDMRTIGEEEYMKRLGAIKRERLELLKSKEQTHHFIISEEEKSNRVDAIKHMHEKIKKNLDNVSYETQDKLMHMLVNRIDVNLSANEAQVEFHFPKEFLEDTSQRGGFSKDLEESHPSPMFLRNKSYSSKS